MRKWLIPLWLLPAAFCACTTTFPTTSPEDSWLLHVECRNDLSVRQTVLFVMRQGRPRDIREDRTSAIMIIEAAYYKEDNPTELLQKIADDLQRTVLVSEVHIEENHAMVRQTR